MRKALLLASFATAVAAGGSAALASLDPTPGEVYRVWLDGRVSNLTRSSANDMAPVVSPDGARVGFVSDRRETASSRRERIFVVGSDGQGLVQIGPALDREQDFSQALAWSPNGKTLAVAAAAAGQVDPARQVWSLYLFTPGSSSSTRVLARGPAMLNPAWSPSGRVLAVHAQKRIWGVTATGKVIWRLKGLTYLQDGRSWSATGRLALLLHGRIGVYDERGRLRVPFFRGRSFSWERAGRRLASLVGNRLEVRSLSGRVTFRSKAVPGLPGHNGLVWADSGHVVIGGIGPLSRSVTVDLSTGRISQGGGRYFGLRSPDRRLVAFAAKVGNGFDLRVSRPDGSHPRTLASRPNCPDLIEGDIGWFPDSKSLVYDFACQGR